MIFMALILAFGLINFSLAAKSTENETSSKTESVEQVEKKDTEELDNRRGNASKTTINRVTTQSEKIEKYTNDLGGNKTNGIVFYWLNVVKDYSIPVFFVLFVIAALNYFIIGNKKLDKREQGFRMIVTLLVGLIIFQVLPFLFAIIVAGR
jgi:hypothetical protein